MYHTHSIISVRNESSEQVYLYAADVSTALPLPSSKHEQRWNSASLAFAA